MVASDVSLAATAKRPGAGAGIPVTRAADAAGGR